MARPTGSDHTTTTYSRRPKSIKSRTSSRGLPKLCVGLIFIAMAAAGCGSPQERTDRMTRIDNCLAACQSSSDGHDPATDNRFDDGFTDQRSMCEQRCH